MADRPRALPTGIALDAVGHALYARVTALPCFTAARAEAELLRVHRWEILDLAGGPREIVDLRAGTAVQARPLLDSVASYVAVEPCCAVLDDALDGLGTAFPHLATHGVVGDAAFGLRASRAEDGPRLVLLLESTLGRLDPTASRLELVRIRSEMTPGDRLLIGMDLAKAESCLGDAFNDPTGVVAAYFRNAFRRANREVGTDFRSADWTFAVEPQPEHGRVELRFEARSAVAVNGGRAGDGWDFMPGDALVVERAHKPTEAQVAALALAAGFRIAGAWTDGPQGYGLFLLEL